MDWPSIIRTVRERLGLSQTQFGAIFGVSFVTVCRWETGVYLPTSKTKKKIIELCRENKVPMKFFALIRSRSEG